MSCSKAKCGFHKTVAYSTSVVEVDVLSDFVDIPFAGHFHKDEDTVLVLA